MCGGSCNSLNNFRERLDQEPRDIQLIYFEVCMLIMELTNSIKKEDDFKIIDELNSFIDIYFSHNMQNKIS